MKAQDLGAVVCRVGAIVLIVRGLLQFIISPYFFQDGFEHLMFSQWFYVVIIPFALLVGIAFLLWRYAERLGQSVVPENVAVTDLPGFSTQSLTSVAISVTGIAIAAGSIPRIAQYTFFIMSVSLNPSNILVRTDSISQLIGALAGLTVGIALFFGGSLLSKQITKKGYLED